MGESEFEDDIVYARFIAYIKKAFVHKKLNFLRDSQRYYNKFYRNDIDELEYLIEKSYITSIDEECLESDKKIKIFKLWTILSSGILSKKQKEVIYLSYFKKLTNKAIALELEITERAVEKLKQRAISKIREYFSDEIY